jgi:hypothetical protein
MTKPFNILLAILTTAATVNCVHPMMIVNIIFASFFGVILVFGLTRVKNRDDADAEGEKELINRVHDLQEKIIIMQSVIDQLNDRITEDRKALHA